MSWPVPLNILQSLLEEKRQILSFIVTYSYALDVNMTVFFGKLLEKDYLQVNLVKSLEKTLLVVRYLSQNILVKTNCSLLVINRCQD